VYFATREEAEKAGNAKFNAWMQAEGSRAIEADQHVNYRWDEEAHEIKSVEPQDAPAPREKTAEEKLNEAADQALRELKEGPQFEREPRFLKPLKDQPFNPEMPMGQRIQEAELLYRPKRNLPGVIYGNRQAPPTEALVVARVAAPSERDLAMESSAGTAGLARFQARGSRVLVNEITSRRAELLRRSGYEKVAQVDGEQIDNPCDEIWPEEKDPTLAVISPPFTAAGESLCGQFESGRFQRRLPGLAAAAVRLAPGHHSGRRIGAAQRSVRSSGSKFKIDRNPTGSYSLRRGLGRPCLTSRGSIAPTLASNVRTKSTSEKPSALQTSRNSNRSRRLVPSSYFETLV
jgi:hypothetical protein